MGDDSQTKIMGNAWTTRPTQVKGSMGTCLSDKLEARENDAVKVRTNGAPVFGFAVEHDPRRYIAIHIKTYPQWATGGCRTEGGSASARTREAGPGRRRISRTFMHVATEPMLCRDGKGCVDNDHKSTQHATSHKRVRDVRTSTTVVLSIQPREREINTVGGNFSLRRRWWVNVVILLVKSVQIELVIQSTGTGECGKRLEDQSARHVDTHECRCFAQLYPDNFEPFSGNYLARISGPFYICFAPDCPLNTRKPKFQQLLLGNMQQKVCAAKRNDSMCPNLPFQTSRLGPYST
jgi:hypothetical protein